MEARCKQEKREEAYRVYITDALKAITGNTAHHIGLSGVVDYGTELTQRFVEQFEVEDEEPEPEDTRTASEFAADMWKRMRRKGEK